MQTVRTEVLKVDVVEIADPFDFSYISDKAARQEVENIARSYQSKKTREIGTKMTIILKDDIPIYQKPRRLSLSEQEEVDNQLRTWLENGIRSSDSDYANPVVLIKKKSGDTRICVDFQKLNKKIIKDRYPLSRIDDQLQGATVFSTIDLRNGCFHVEIAEESRKYTSFVVPTGHYEFIWMPFGLCAVLRLKSRANFGRGVARLDNGHSATR